MSGQLDWGRITIFWGDGFLLLIFLVILILISLCESEEIRIKITRKIKKGSPRNERGVTWTGRGGISR
jgi:hypothetical protein